MDLPISHLGAFRIHEILWCSSLYRTLMVSIRTGQILLDEGEYLTNRTFEDAKHVQERYQSLLPPIGGGEQISWRECPTGHELGDIVRHRFHERDEVRMGETHGMHVCIEKIAGHNLKYSRTEEAVNRHLPRRELYTPVVRLFLFLRLLAPRILQRDRSIEHRMIWAVILRICHEIAVSNELHILSKLSVTKSWFQFAMFQHHQRFRV